MRGVLTAVIVVASAFLAGCLDEQPTDGTAGPDMTQPMAMDLPASPAWISKADAPLPRAEHCVAQVDGTFYLVGGYIIPQPMSPPGAAGGVPVAAPTNTVVIYDAASDSFSDGPAYPTQTIDHCLAVGYDGWIYVFHSGGNNKIQPGGAWQAFAESPNGHNSGMAAVIGDKIYLAGSSEFVDAYDPATDAWTTFEAPIPTRRGHTSGAALFGKLYVIGGDTSGHAVNTDANQEFDPATGQWTNRSVLPVMRGSLQAFAWFDHIVVMGGQNGASNVPAFDDVHAYDPLTDSWTELPKMDRPRHGFGGAVWQDQIYVFAGAPQQGVSGFAATDVLSPGG